MEPPGQARLSRSIIWISPWSSRRADWGCKEIRTRELLLQVCLFPEDLVRERPAEDIRILAAARTQEPSEEGRERLTQAMRELL